MTFWQLAIDANDPERLATFWPKALGYVHTPPALGATWHEHYRSRLGDEHTFTDRLFDPDGSGPALWFQRVPEPKAGKNRLHIDIYPTGRDDRMSLQDRMARVEDRVAELVSLGATVSRRTRDDDPLDPIYYVVMNDPEGNEFCVS